MTTREFSDEFDVLFNNIMSNQAPGLDEYEKSVFLTKAEKQLVREHFDRVLDKTQQGFDGSIKRQYDFSSLLKVEKLYNITHHWKNDNLSLGQDTFNLDGIPYIMPLDFYLPVNELITDKSNNKYAVIPLTYDQYQLRQAKPFPFPNKREAWRIITNQRGINYGSTTIKYEGATGNDEAEVICYTTFASEGKDMKFSLKERIDVNLDIIDLREQGIIEDEVWNVYQGFASFTDGYAALKREENHHNLEHISLSMHHIDEDEKIKLWDDDFILDYTFDGVTNAAGEVVDCIYQETGAIAITEVTVKGEASALGLLKVYMHLTESLENEAIGHDPYTLIACINFEHWEEGELKQGTWIIWNGGWGYKKTFLFHKLETPILIAESTEEFTPYVSFTNNDEIVSRKYGIAISNSVTSGVINYRPDRSVKAGKTENAFLSSMGGKYIVGYFTTFIGATKDQVYDRAFSITYYPSKMPSGTVVSYPIVDTTTYTPNEYYLDGTKSPERLDMVNVRHWDYADNFIWPQRIKFKDLKDYSMNSTIFEVEMKHSTAPAVEIVGRFKGGIQSYMMRYVRKPKPIILEELDPQNLSIEGVSSVTECELPEECHEEILERAVTLAKLSYGGTTMTQAESKQ